MSLVHVTYATTGGGKTESLVNTASELVLNGRNVLYITGEDPVDTIRKRINAKHFGIQRIYGSVSIYRFDGISIFDVVERISELLERNVFAAICLDYLNLFPTYPDSVSVRDSLNRATEELVKTAVKYGVPIYTAVQAKRGSYAKEQASVFSG